MPRTSRLLQDGGLYHLMARGNNRQALFHQPADYQRLLTLLGEASADHQLAVFHYCLMSNHLHLVVRTASGPALPLAMRALLLGYARYYRKQHTYVGHVFQGRYRSLPISDDAYLLECGRYVERNPIRAGLVDAPAAYPYSSYRHYAAGEPNPLVTLNPLYDALGPTAAVRQQRYRAYVATTRPYDTVVDRTFLRG